MIRINICLLFILLFTAQILIAQTNTDTSSVIITRFSFDRVKQKREKIKAYTDIINNYDGGELPVFLFDECFDHTQARLQEGIHLNASLRWKVLQNVTNKKSLKQILAKNDERLRRKCKHNSDSYSAQAIPMLEKSFYELIRKRYKEL